MVEYGLFSELDRTEGCSEADLYTAGDRVWITYPNSINANREALVVEDLGGPKITVKWQTYRQTGRGASAGWVGNRNWREQRIPRDRIKPRHR